jgi:AraC-like DNA-binding protein
MEPIDLKKTLRDILAALEPLFSGHDLRMILVDKEVPLMTKVPLDDVLAPVLSLILKLIYIVPAGRDLNLSASVRIDPATESRWLQIELDLYNFNINPNLIVKPTNNRFKIETTPARQSRILIEWPVDPEDELEPPRPRPGTEFETSSAQNAQLLSFHYFDESIANRYLEYGQNPFIREKLLGQQSRKAIEFVARLNQAIIGKLSEADFDTDALCRTLGYSRAQLHRKIKELTGLSTANYIRHVRLHKAAELLDSTDKPIGEIAELVGFREPAYFSASFSESFNASPTEWRKGRKVRQ